MEEHGCVLTDDQGATCRRASNPLFSPVEGADICSPRYSIAYDLNETHLLATQFHFRVSLVHSGGGNATVFCSDRLPAEHPW